MVRLCPGRLPPMTQPPSFTRIRQMEPLAAIQALARLGPEESVIRTLSHFLGHAEPLLRIEAIRALGGMGPDAVRYLAAPLADADPMVRREAATTLGKIGPPSAPAVPALIEALKDQDLKTRTAATLALGQIGAPAAPAVAALMEVLRGPFLILSRLAAQALSRIGAAAVPALVEGLITADSYGRREAAWALGEIGPAAVGVMPGTRLDDTPAPALLRPVTRPPDAQVQSTVPIFLGASVPVERSAPTKPRPRTGERLPDPVTALTDAMRDEDSKVREAAARAIDRIRARR